VSRPIRATLSLLALASFLAAPAAAETELPEIFGDQPGDGLQIVASPDGAFTLRAHGMLQPRLVFFDMGDDTDLNPIVSGDPDDREGFKLRRARVGFSGKLGKPFAWKLMMGYDANYDLIDKTVRPETLGFSVLDAYMEWVSTPYFQVRGGAMKVPFGGQHTQSSSGLALVERAVVAERLAPAYDVGMRLHGSIGGGKAIFAPQGLSWYVGAYSGDGTVMDPDDNLGLLWVGRLSVSLGDDLGATESCLGFDGFGVRIGGGGGFNFERESRDQFVGGDLMIKAWRFALRGEFLTARRVPSYQGVEDAPFPEQFRRHGYLMQLGFMIVPDLLEVAFRHDFYDDDLQDEDDYSNVRYFQGGANLFFLEGRIKVQLNYIHRYEPGELPGLKNDTILAQGTLVL